jgi:DNA-binding response OmpR family regulator
MIYERPVLPEVIVQGSPIRFKGDFYSETVNYSMEPLVVPADATARGDGLPCLPTCGVALILPDSSMDLGDLGAGLRVFSFCPVVLSRKERLDDVLARWKPVVAIVGGGVDDLAFLLRTLEASRTPVLFIGNNQQLQAAASLPGIEVGIPRPAFGREIGNAASILAATTATTCPAVEVAEVGPLRLDLVERLAAIDGRTLKLPPREFSVLAQLALHPKRPILPIELARRIDPRYSMTADDVRRCVYRLRRLMCDEGRVPPLIQTRRGFGYVIGGT